MEGHSRGMEVSSSLIVVNGIHAAWGGGVIAMRLVRKGAKGEVGIED